jgi:hypothetical protein
MTNREIVSQGFAMTGPEIASHDLVRSTSISLQYLPVEVLAIVDVR